MSQELKMDVKVGTGPAGKQKAANGNVWRNKEIIGEKNMTIIYHKKL